MSQMTQEEVRALKTQLETERDNVRKAASDLSQIERNLEKEKDSTIKNERNKIEAAFGKEIKDVEAKIREVNKERQNKKNHEVKSRIENETNPSKERIKALKGEVSNELKAASLPAYCGSLTYHRFFRPSHALDFVLVALMALVFLVGIPFIVTWFIRGQILKYIVFAALDAVFAFIYVLIFSLTRGKDPHALKKVRNTLDDIVREKKNIENAKKRISNDRSEATYGLDEFDEQLKNLEAQKTDINQKCTDALKEFDTVTAVQTGADIDAKYTERLDTYRAALEAAEAKVKELEEQVKNAEESSEYANIG
ncbi:MAG: hypothetical protein Q4B67_07890 [Eubacteriales bacterium]|nr:hypothetical protein [Eubacteriales bacterium]